MKRKILAAILTVLIFSQTGCFKRDNLEGINIVTTVYPIEYVTNYLYKDHANIASIYPDGVDTTTYNLSKKQLQDYSKKDLFIYNGLDNDKELAINFLDKNKNMLIIDATYGMEYINNISELWLNPSNLLMMTQNIKDGLKEYMTNSYLEKELDEKYEQLKLLLSELDAEIKITAENASRKTIVVNNDTLKYLEKYGFTVISLDDSKESISDRTKEEVTEMINNKTINHLFVLENTITSEVFNQIVEDTKVEISTYRRLDSITDSERDELKDYISIMNENIELLKNELY